ncbi:SDR family NAD(P)-dependent oxidoreductase [Paenibacillus sp. FJAT-27812]|uniref:SDR family NAD(P)-dependent oxidoreductase n=1 Tax=Paenibacillus sp. FJAT-27812 TaxID=1684143 RepID=UPI0006A7CF6C|nr:SDR family oxidoreductase [Paenibacillus sp. FJAT-27812]
MLLHKKVVFITDSDQISGKAIINRLTQGGAHFILNSRSGGTAITSELEQVQEAGSQAIVVNIDLCKSADVADMLQFAEQQLGAVDVLIHNNKEVYQSSIEFGDEEVFTKSLAINAKSAFICTQQVGKQMMEKQAGKIIYVSSIHAEKPTGSAFTFSVSKGAVKMLAKEASLVLGRNGVSVNTIELGPLDGDHEVFESTLSTLYNDYEYKIPNAVLGSADDLAELVMFLSSDEARYINGSDIRLDGGFLLHYMNFKMKRP